MTVFSLRLWLRLSVCPSLLEATQATQGLCRPPCRLPGARRDEGRPLCEEMIFSVLRRTLQIISSNLSNGPEMLLPLSCNGDRWLAGQTGPARRPSKGRTILRVHTHKHLHKTPLHWWPMWLQVIVSSQDVVLVVILNDHSKRGVLTICPFTGKMIPLYRLAPLLPRPP